MKNQLQIAKQCFFAAAKYWWPIVLNNWGTLLAIIIFVQAQAQLFLYYQKLLPQDQMIQILCQVGIAGVSLVEAIFLLVLVPLRMEEIDRGSPPQSYWQFFKKHIGPLTIEGIRMSAYVILWTLLLILPGIYKQLKWYLMPFVVMFDKDYENDQVDCLERSNQLVTGILPLVLLLVIADFLIQQGGDSYALSFPPEVRLYTVALFSLLTMGVSIYTYAMFYSLYRIRNKEIPKTLAEDAQ